MNIPAAKPARRIGLTIWMIVSQLLALGSLVPWLILTIVTIAFQDDPRGPSLEVWLLMLAIWAYPIFPIGMSIAAWIAYALRKNKLAAVLAAILLVPIFLCLGWVAFDSIRSSLIPHTIYVTPFP